jgi:hypothetical protein
MSPLGETGRKIEERTLGSPAAKIADDEQKSHGKTGRGDSLDSDFRRCLIGQLLPYGRRATSPMQRPSAALDR